MLTIVSEGPYRSALTCKLEWLMPDCRQTNVTETKNAGCETVHPATMSITALLKWLHVVFDEAKSQYEPKLTSIEDHVQPFHQRRNRHGGWMHRLADLNHMANEVLIRVRPVKARVAVDHGELAEVHNKMQLGR